MYCQCPHCLTIYRIGLDELTTGRGQAVCGSCDQSFDTLATLSTALPPEPIERLDTITPRSPVPMLRHAVLRPKPAQPSLFDAAKPEPGSFLRQTQVAKTPADRRRWAWIAACTALTFILIAQVLYAERERVLAIPTYRAWAEAACGRFGCTLPGSEQAIEGLALVSRDIRKHPSVDGALLITATLANRSPQVRPYPVLELRLSDLHERAIAMRRFQPAEYLSDPSRVERGMPPETTLPIEFEVVDPGPDAMAFEFRFLPAR